MRRVKKEKNDELKFDCFIISVNGVLFWWGWRLLFIVVLANARAPWPYHRCTVALPASWRPLRGTRTWRQTPVAPFSHFIIQTSIFLQREMDCFSWMLPLRCSGQDDWPGTMTRDWRLLQGWKSPKSGLFSSANAGRAHHQTSTVFFKQAEKKSSPSKPC